MPVCGRHRRPRSRPTGWAAVLALALGSTVALVAQDTSESLYTCVDDTAANANVVGVTVCTAEGTDVLTARAEADNLQVRAGARVSEIDPSGVGAAAGLAVDDVIYRIGGVDVDDAESATAELDTIGATADTVVNFLRSGRPYRVKLRQ